MKIPRRQLGPQGLEVSAIGLGCMGMSDFYGPSDEATNLKVLHAALDIGDRRSGQPHALGDLLLRQSGLTASRP